MPMQRNHPAGGDRLSEPAVAVQQDFPEVEIQGNVAKSRTRRSPHECPAQNGGRRATAP